MLKARTSRNLWTFMVILAVCAVASTRYLTAQRSADARLVDCKKNVDSLLTAAEMYCGDHEGRYPRSLAELVPDYVKSIPICPSARSDTYSAGYREGPDVPQSGGRDFVYLCCRGYHHQEAGARPDHPWGPGVCALGASPEDVERIRADYLR